MLRKVLVANRGEIAVRVQQTLQAMGIRTVAAYQEPDRGALHVLVADEAFPLASAVSSNSYLDGEAFLSIARASGASGVHPGYGFLAENPAFARGCQDAGLTFIGPPAEVMALAGNKLRCKEAARGAGLPVLEAVPLPDLAPGVVSAAAQALGFPLLVKAVASGGGRGIRLVQSPLDLQDAVDLASREAGAAFGDGRVFLEQYLPGARHVEFQVLADHHGNVVHLFERECSVQRRRQKIIEETPSPTLDAPRRRAMGEAAVALARAVGYRNAGTIEFLVSRDGRFFFLETNTRLQVEHPITEAVTGVDMVREQVRIAEGRPLPAPLRKLRARGHAIECRICAEDPYQDFAPATGKLLRWRPPSGPGIRVDSGVAEGQEVSAYYDSLLAKLIVWGPDRATALARTAWALRHFVVLGVVTNIPFLSRVIGLPAFQRGDYHTGLLEESAELLERQDKTALSDPAAAIASAHGILLAGDAPQGTGSLKPAPATSPWSPQAGLARTFP